MDSYRICFRGDPAGISPGDLFVILLEVYCVIFSEVPSEITPGGLAGIASGCRSGFLPGFFLTFCPEIIREIALGTAGEIIPASPSESRNSFEDFSRNSFEDSFRDSHKRN